jgi:lathosterol oxidase
MDFVLEVFDTVLFDRMYAALFDPISTLTAGFKSFDNSTTFGDATQAADVARSSWQFEAASEYASLQPSEYAWMSKWDRNNVWRQFISLYIITW